MELDKINADLAIAVWENTREGQAAVQHFSDAIAESIDKEILQMLSDVSVTTALPQEMMANGEDVIIATLPECGDGQFIAADDSGWIKYEMAPAQEINFTLAAVPSDNAVSLFNNNPHSLIVEIKRSGEVTLGKDIDPKFAAHEFWTRLAEVGGEFEKRFAELEEAHDDEQSQKLELQEIVSDIANALGIPQATEYDIADYAAKLVEQLEALRGQTPAEQPAEDPRQAYERAMKVVR